MTTISRLSNNRRNAWKRIPSNKLLLPAGLLVVVILLALNVSSSRGGRLSTNDMLTTTGRGLQLPHSSPSSIVDVTGRTCLAQPPLSNVFAPGSAIGAGNCSYSWGQGWHEKTAALGALRGFGANGIVSPAQRQDLKTKLETLVTKWKYDNRVKNVRKHFPDAIGEGKRVLDVGMGQGPWGAAMISQAKLAYYVGLDPDVCPPVHARTRDTTVPRKGSIRQCLKAYNLTSEKDDTEGKIEGCVGKNKYHAFEMTGLEMMAAYPDQLALLAGTFETLTDQLQSLVFDVVLLNTVTEHLSQLQPVFQGLWELMGKGCSKNAQVLIDHHNYMDYSGHHGFPKTAEELKSAPPELRELADWGHLTDDASQSQNPSLNRVRPGDLQALLNVYFDCQCERTYVAKAERERLTEERKAHFTKLGFDVEMELFTKHVLFRCQRRQTPHNPEILENLNLYHSPLDGSYKPQPFTNCRKL